MKRLILLAIIGFVYPNFSYANTQNTCGSNIKDGIIICYDLKSYNKNPKISLEFNGSLKEDDDVDYSNNDWEMKYNLEANLVYKVVVKQNSKITFTKNYESMEQLDTEYEVYYNIIQTNNKVQSDLISYKIHPKNFYPQYSTQLSQIIKTYKNLDENNFEIKKSEYIINTLTPLLEPEKEKLKKIEDKRNSILGDDFKNYMNSLKEKDNQDKQNNINQIADRAEQIKQSEKDLSIQVENLEQALVDMENADIKLKEISSKQSDLQNQNHSQNDLSRMFNNVSGKNSKRANEWDELEKQKEEQLTILKDIRSKYGYKHTIERNIKELKYKQSNFNENYDNLQKDIEIEKNNQDDRELSYEFSQCSITTFHKPENEDTPNISDNTYSYKHIENCYKKFIDDDDKLEMLHNIDNIYIKQHKKTQFIINTIEKNKSNIETVKKKIESDKMKKELEAELS